MSQQQSPWLEGKYGWAFGESGWNSGMDENLLKFSFMFTGVVDQVASSLPAAVNGAAVFLTTDNRFYFSVGTTWYSSPCPKWFTFKIKDTGQVYQFDGTSTNLIDSPEELEGRISSIEVTISQLGSAAFEETSFFASQSALDVASAQANSYADAAVSGLSTNLSSSAGAGQVGYDVGETYPAGTAGAELKTQKAQLDALAIGIPGAVGDGVADDTAAIQAAVTASGGVVTFEQGKTYKITDSILVDHPVLIDLNGASIDAQLTTQVPAFDVQSNYVRICNGSISVNGTTMGGYGGSLNCIYAGNQSTGAGWHNLRFHDLTVTTNRNDAGAHIGVIGECHNVIIENIKVPDNAVCRNIIGIEWGGTPGGGTGHPHNITVRNLEIGRITTATYGSGGYAYAVWISAAFDVHVENITMIEGYGLVMATRGDNANTYAPAKYKHLVGRGITVNNASLTECFGYGIRAIGSHRSGTLDNIPMSVAFRNIKVGGKKVGANNNFGFSAEQSDGVILEDFEFTGTFAAGITTGVNNDNLYIGRGSVSGCELYGCSLGNSCRWPTVAHVRFTGNNTSGGGLTSTAALAIDDALHPDLQSNKFGSPGEAETQKYSISMTASTVSPRLNRNHTYALAASGVAYANSTASDVRGASNTAEAGLTLSSGTAISNT